MLGTDACHILQVSGWSGANSGPGHGFFPGLQNSPGQCTPSFLATSYEALRTTITNHVVSNRTVLCTVACEARKSA